MGEEAFSLPLGGDQGEGKALCRWQRFGINAIEWYEDPARRLINHDVTHARTFRYDETGYPYMNAELNPDPKEVDSVLLAESRSDHRTEARRPSRLKDFAVQWWPMVLIVIVFAAVYALLLVTLGDALHARREVGSVMRGQSGPVTLFMLASGIMGWVIVLTLEYSLGNTGLFQWPIAVFFSAVAACLGVLCAKATGRPLPEGPEGLAVLCVFFAGAVSLSRVLYVRFMP